MVDDDPAVVVDGMIIITQNEPIKPIYNVCNISQLGISNFIPVWEQNMLCINSKFILLFAFLALEGKGGKSSMLEK